ncbi:MAG TPA: DUF1824 family protein [Geminocystis sp. M7585_C2015_104]|nr:DUF1824 family protein [Geminocystis sp. M7585_C2015_104]
MERFLAESLSLLKSYSCSQVKVINSQEEKKQLQEALKLIVSLSDAQNFGICADNIEEAVRSLNSYLRAFGSDFEVKIEKTREINSGVYMKFSTEKKNYYWESYPENYRGVLLTIFSRENEAIVGTYGYFPLDLFE